VSGRICKEINTDAGSEFVAQEFKDTLKEKGITMHRVSESKNDLATLDRAMGTLKVILTKRTVTIGAGNWIQELKKATISYNNTAHEHLDDEAPNDVQDNKSLQFELQVQAARDHDTQTKLDTRRQKKAEENGYFREETAASKVLKGLRPRGHKPKYDEEVRTIDRIDGRHVYDTEGRKSLIKRILPVPEDTVDVAFPTSALKGDERKKKAQLEATAELATKVAGVLKNGAKDIAQLSGIINTTDKATLRANKLSMRKFLEIHSGTFKLQGRKATLAQELANEPGTSSSSNYIAPQPPAQQAGTFEAARARLIQRARARSAKPA
jgi:hypothetical protein